MSAENNADTESDSLSMVDVLAEQSRMQEDASAVLGDSDEQNCTYPKASLTSLSISLFHKFQPLPNTKSETVYLPFCCCC